MKRIILQLALLFSVATMGFAQSIPAYLLFDAAGNAYPSGGGTPLPGGNPPAFTCYTNVTGQVLPCNFSGGSTTINPLTGAASGGAAPGSTFNGSVPVTFDYHTLGAVPLAGGVAMTGNLPITLSSGSIFLNLNTTTGLPTDTVEVEYNASRILEGYSGSLTAAVYEAQNGKPIYQAVGCTAWITGCTEVVSLDVSGWGFGSTFTTASSQPFYVTPAGVVNATAGANIAGLAATGGATVAGGLGVTGGVTANSDGVHAGYDSLIGNTANQTVIANTAGWMGPPSASLTAYALQLPSTGPTNTEPVLSCGTPVSGVSPCTFVAASGGSYSGSTTTAVSANTTVATAAANTIPTLDGAGNLSGTAQVAGAYPCLQTEGTSGSGIGTGTTRYTEPCGIMNWGSTESGQTVAYPRSGTISNLYACINTTLGASGSLTVSIRTGTFPATSMTSQITLTFPASSTAGCQGPSGSFSYTAGQAIDYQVVNSTGGTVFVQNIYAEFSNAH